MYANPLPSTSPGSTQGPRRRAAKGVVQGFVVNALVEALDEEVAVCIPGDARGEAPFPSQRSDNFSGWLVAGFLARHFVCFVLGCLVG